MRFGGIGVVRTEKLEVSKPPVTSLRGAQLLAALGVNPTTAEREARRLYSHHPLSPAAMPSANPEREWAEKVVRKS